MLLFDFTVLWNCVCKLLKRYIAERTEFARKLWEQTLCDMHFMMHITQAKSSQLPFDDVTMFTQP